MEADTGISRGVEDDAVVVDLSRARSVIDLTATNAVPDPGAEAVQPHIPTITLIIPVMNEEKNLPHVLPKIPDWVTEVIVVDGHSTDRSIEIVESVAPDATIITQPGKGKGDAMAAGFAAASGDILVSVDADGSMDPSELYAHVGQLMAGADLVKGSRFLQGGGTTDMEWYRRFGNRLLVWFTRLLYGQRFSDLCYGFVSFWRDSLEVIDPDVDGFEIEACISARALRAGLQIAEVPSFEARRLNGVSNLRTFTDGWRVLRTLVAERVRSTESG